MLSHNETSKCNRQHTTVHSFTLDCRKETRKTRETREKETERERDAAYANLNLNSLAKQKQN